MSSNCSLDGNVTCFSKFWNDANLTNVSDYNSDTDPGYILRYGITATIFLSLAYGLVFVVGVLGNIAVVVVVTKSTNMRSPTNQFIANLAIADLLVNILCLPFTLVANLFPAWILGVFFCKAVSYLQGVSVSASVNTLMAISLERCAAISFPLSGTMTSKQYRMAVTLIWTVALLINIPWLVVFTLEPIGITGSMAEVCIELWPSQQTENIYFAIANLTICYLGPLSVITICYAIIWKNVANRSVPGERIGNRQHYAINRSKVKVIKMIFVVIITFTLSWLPLYTIFCLAKFSGELLEDETVQHIIHIILPIAQWLGAANSCINPILYAFMNRKFRVGFKGLINKTNNSSSHPYDVNVNGAITLKDYSRSPGKIRRNIIRAESLRMAFSDANNLTLIPDSSTKLCV